MKTTPALLTTAETDELILAACRPKDGAIEDAEVTNETVTYYFETGVVGIVSRTTGDAEIGRGEA